MSKPGVAKPGMSKRAATPASLVLALGFVFAQACTEPRPETPSVAALPAIASARYPLPAELPARYLRTLAHDPGGYDAASPPGGPVRGGASDLLLGDLLFHSPATLGARSQKLGISCQSCHPNGVRNAEFTLAGVAEHPGLVDVTTGVFRTGGDDGRANALAIPSLRGVRFTGPYGHDGRIASLAEFTANVVTVEFDGEPLAARKLSALVSYMHDFDFLPNQQLDGRGKLAHGAAPAALRGETIFSRPFPGFGGKSCASCHDPSTFFRDGRVHRLGSGSPASPHAIEDGEETPTLLGTAETAPYFHDGRFVAISDVIAWFDGSFALGLSAEERSDLTAYVQAVGAIDQTRDERPLARKLSQTFAYVALATDPDATVRRAAIDEVLLALSGEPASLAPRATELRTELERMRQQAAHGALDELEVRRARDRLTRLAADWAGALARK